MNNKKWEEEYLRFMIDNASYKELLFRWRFSPAGDPIFKGALGEYYLVVMDKKRENIGQEEHVKISKSIGW